MMFGRQKKVSFSEKLFFTKHLTVMVKSGIPIAEILWTLMEQAKSGGFKETLQRTHEDVSRGQSLEKAFSKHGNVFDPFYVNLVRVGEESGTLEESLGYLTEQLERENNLRKKVQSAMLYPALVLGATGAIGLGLAFFVLPQISEMFKDLNVKLPITTKLLILFSDLLREQSYLLIGGMFIVLLLIALIFRSSRIKPLRDMVLLKLPIFGYFSRSICLAALCRNLAIMLKSGLPVTAALETAQNTERNAVYKRILEGISEDVRKGKSIGSAIKERGYREFPTYVIRMIEVGERSGNLEENLAYLGDYFEAEVDVLTKNMSSILEPVLLLMIGGVVAFVALSIITPIYQVTGSIR